ncbi:MAG: DAK2 domain-containing protein [Acholeplasmatales bacterium]|nr:DAK2 domain-containing protein [Acholeplasmatales bacterium]
MDVKMLDGLLFEKMVYNGLKNLKQNIDLINSLNVFPVPDGDTGINMFLTLENGYLKSNRERNLGLYLKSLSKGMLLGARGNSGVILSQLFRGLAKSLADKQEANTTDLVNAFIASYRAAYSAVVNPQEGTMLTTSREGIELIKKNINNDTTIDQLIVMYHNQLRISLAETPKHLITLREAGVVDSGAYGLMIIYEGFVKYLEGIILDDFDIDDKSCQINENNFTVNNSNYKYLVTFKLQLEYIKIDFIEENIPLIKDELLLIGDIMSFSNVDNNIDVVIATDSPGVVVNTSQKYGEFIDIKIDTIKNDESLEELAFFAITQGEGLINTLKELGCKYVLERGSNTTISTDEIIDIFKDINAKNIICLPNNVSSGIIIKCASEKIKDKNVYVIESKTPVESYLAMSMVVGDNFDSQFQVKQMNNGIKDVKTIFLKCDEEVYALLDGKKYSSNEYLDTLKQVFNKVPQMDKREIVILFKGINMDDDLLDEITNFIYDEYPDIEVGVIDAMQDDYELIIGVN